MSDGLGLPALSSVYKWLQVSRQCILLMSLDPCVRHLAERNLRGEAELKWHKFKPAVLVHDVLASNPGYSRKVLRMAAVQRVSEEDDESRRKHLVSLEKQGQMLGSVTTDLASLWCSAVQSLPDEQRKFILNAAVDTLPHNCNLRLWRDVPIVW